MSDFSKYGVPSDEWLALEPKLPPPPEGLSLTERRTLINSLRETAAAESVKTLSKWISTTDHTITTRDGTTTLQARSYRPVGHDGMDGDATAEPLPVYIHFHGGGFLFGTLASEDAISARIAINARVCVVNVNYRHTPEHKYPVAWNDAEDAFAWVHDNISLLWGDPTRVLVGGISAGACLTASLALRKHLGLVLQEYPPIAGLVLMVPSLVHMDCYGPQLAQIASLNVSSFESCKDAPILSRDTCRMFMDLLGVTSPDPINLQMNPGNASAEHVKGLPPTVFGIAGLDPLRDEGLLFAKKLAEAGVPTDINVFKGLPHGFRRFGESLSECKRWDRVMESGIVWALAEPEADGFVIKE